MKKIAYVLLVLAIAGCKTRPVPTSYSLQTSPPVGTTVTIGVGERMLSQGHASTVDAIVLASDIMFGEITVKQGKYPLAGETSEYQHFKNVHFLKGNRPSDRGRLFLFKKDAGTKTICLSRSQCTETDYSMDKDTTYSPSRTQQTLIYSGKIGDRITLGYREFRDDMARAAFSNDVTYDLSESKVLGYKGARVEVVKATNTEITYKVLAGFN